MAFFLRPKDGSSYRGFNVDSSGWLKTDESNCTPVQFEVYKNKGVNYLKVNDPGSKWDGKYLSVNKNGYLGLYAWTGASGWSLSGKSLVSAYNGQIVGISSDGFYQAASGVQYPVTFENSSDGAFYAGLS